jgi:hypothetical protein
MILRHRTSAGPGSDSSMIRTRPHEGVRRRLGLYTVDSSFWMSMVLWLRCLALSSCSRCCACCSGDPRLEYLSSSQTPIKWWMFSSPFGQDHAQVCTPLSYQRKYESIARHQSQHDGGVCAVDGAPLTYLEPHGHLLVLLCLVRKLGPLGICRF